MGMGVSPAPPWATTFFALYDRTLVPRWSKYSCSLEDSLALFFVAACVIQTQKKMQDNGLHSRRSSSFGMGLSRHALRLQTCVSWWSQLRALTWRFSIHAVVFLLPPDSLHSKGLLLILSLSRSCIIAAYHRTSLLLMRRLKNFINVSWPMDASMISSSLSSDRQNEMPPTTWPVQRLIDYNHVEPPRRRKLNCVSTLMLTCPCHPDDPPSRDIQKLWRDNVAHPPGKTPHPKCVNLDGDEVGFEKLMVAYHRPTKFGKFVWRAQHSWCRKSGVTILGQVDTSFPFFYF